MKAMETSSRSNYQYGITSKSLGVGQQVASTQVYMFVNNLQSPVSKYLISLCTKNKYNYRGSELGRLDEIELKSAKKTICLIEVEDQNKDGSSNIPTIVANQHVKTITFAYKPKETGYTHFSTQKQLEQFLRNYFYEKPDRRIQLASIHSIDKNKQQTKSSLKKVKTDTKYSKVLYYKNNQDNEKLNPYYDMLLQVIENQKNFQGFENAKDLSKYEEPKDQKYLVLLSTNENSLAMLKQIKKLNNKHQFDFMLLGDLKPNQQLLDKNVILASNSLGKHLSFFRDNGFTSYNMSQMYEAHSGQKKFIHDLDTVHKNQQNQGNMNIFIGQAHQNNMRGERGGEMYNGAYASEGTSGYQSPTVVRNNGEEQLNQKKVIKKIKSPGKKSQKSMKGNEASQEMNTLNLNAYGANNNNLLGRSQNNIGNGNANGNGAIAKSQRNITDSHSNIAASNRVITSIKDLPISKHKITDNNSNISSNNPNISSNNQNNTISNENITTPKYSESKKQIGNGYENFTNPASQYSIDHKYKMIPSAIIHQNSQEYRGSNKESIVNLQPQSSLKSMKQVNSTGGNANLSHIKYSTHTNPQEQPSNKKIVTKSLIANYPQRQYIHISQNTIDQPQSNPNLNYRNDIYNQYLPYQQNSRNAVQNKIIDPMIDRNTYITDLPKIVSPLSPQKMAASGMNAYTVGNNNNNPNNFSNSHANNAYGGGNSNDKMNNNGNNGYGYNNSNALNYPNSTGTGGIYQYGGSVMPNTTRAYGNSPQNTQYQRYNSPYKVTTFKKGIITAPQIINQNEQSNKLVPSQHRMTFGNLNNKQSAIRNSIIPNYNKESTKSVSNNATSPTYYNVQTLNYNDVKRPQNYKMEVAGRPIQVFSPTKNQEDHSSYGNKYQVKTYGSTNSNHGTTVTSNVISPVKNYEPKSYQNNQTAQSSSYTSSNGINWDDYEKFQRDGITMFRKKGTAGTSPVSKTTLHYQNLSRNPGKQSYRQSQSPKVQRYQVSPLRDKIYTNTSNGTSYQPNRNNNLYRDNHHQTRYQSPKRHQTFVSSYAVFKPNEYDNMIQSSIKKQGKQVDKYGNITYGIGNGESRTRTYAVQYQPVKVNRYETYQPKVQAANSVYKENKSSQSQILLKTQESLSDHSILTKNNIKFGVKLNKNQKRQSISVINSKIMNGMFGMNDFNKKMALNRVIRGQQYLTEQLKKYRHIDTSFNNFHFIIQEDLFYITDILKQHILTKKDKLQIFNGVEGLFNCLKQSNIQQIDGGYIFIRKQDINKINIDLIPQDYYFVFLQSQSSIRSQAASCQQQIEQMLEISQINKQIKLNNLKYLQLSFKIILDNKLYQFIVYCSKDQDLSLLAKKFTNSQFIVEQLQTQFSVDILDCYFYEFSRLTRAYLLCHLKDLAKIMSIKAEYQKANHAFEKESCKIVCVLGKNQTKAAFSSLYGDEDVIFVENPQLISDCKEILVNQTKVSSNISVILQQDIIFYHNFHQKLQKQLENQFPGRFQYYPFDKISEVNSKLSNFHKKKQNKTKKLYLILSEHCKNQKPNVDDFKKVFMLGKVKVVHNKIVRVMNPTQLFELLKK